MSHETGHNSSGGAGTQRKRDSRTTDLTNHHYSQNLFNSALHSFVRDPLGAMGREMLRLSGNCVIRTGMIVYAMPYANWYRVQLDGMGGTVAAMSGSESGSNFGPRASTMYTPGSFVILVIPAGYAYGVILSSFISARIDNRTTLPDWTWQGSQSGYRREQVYRGVIEGMHNNGEVQNFANGHSIDSTILDWGRSTNTGLAIHLDPYMTYIRVSEMCGLYLNYWDQHTRLAGMHLDIQNPAFEIIAKDDEGETNYREFHNPYIWESLGLYAPNTKLNVINKDQDVQDKLPYATLDLAPEDSDVQAISRWQEHSGYLGQGYRRMLMIPAQQEGKRHFKDSAHERPDMGVFEESVALDGSYMLRSAKEMHFIKHVLIPVPKEMRLTEDQKEGDDARKGNYKASGQFGEGPVHKVGDIAVAGSPRHLLECSGLMDILAYSYNWKPLHVYHYHAKDYSVPEEAEIAKLPRGQAPEDLALGHLGGPERAQDILAFGELTSQMYMGYPTPKRIKVDDRYQQVEFFQRTAGWSVLPDGSVVIFDGYGATITMSAGSIRFDCPGDVMLAPGRNIVGLAGDDIALRARNSMDLTAGKKDLRLKASRNLQIVGGDDSQEGGVLIESRASGFSADFQGKIGEDVKQRGIILKAGKSGVAVWSGDIYLRTGTDNPAAEGGLNTGNITLDASRGGSRIVQLASTVECMVANSLDVVVGPQKDNSKVFSYHSLGNQRVVLDGATTVGSNLYTLGSALFDGVVESQSGFGSVSGYGEVGRADAQEFNTTTAEIRQITTTLHKTGQGDHDGIVARLYTPTTAIGNDTVIRQAAFSFRDDPEGLQYNVQNFKLMESRWQQMVRLKGATGGEATWNDEPTLTYQGTKQMPWPGQTKWNSETMLTLEKHTLYDDEKGLAKNRKDNQEQYETPTLSGLTPVTPAGGFRVIMS